MTLEADVNTKAELPHVIDSTMLSSFSSCRRKYYYSHVLNMRPPGISIHLLAGGALADAVAAARLYCYQTEQPNNNDMLVEAFKAFINAWGEYEAPETEAKRFERTWLAVEEYLQQYHPLHDVVQPYILTDNKPSAEFSFAIPLPINHPDGNPFIYAGRIDLLGLHKSDPFQADGLPVVVDEKTTGGLGSWWASQWDLRGQFLGYCWAMQQLGYPVKHSLVRGIGILKTQINFLPVLVPYPQHLIDRWAEEMLVKVLELKQAWETDHWTYNFGEACASYGGCVFKSLCTMKDPTAWYDTFDTYKWNPITTEEIVTPSANPAD